MTALIVGLAAGVGVAIIFKKRSGLEVTVLGIVAGGLLGFGTYLLTAPRTVTVTPVVQPAAPSASTPTPTSSAPPGSLCRTTDPVSGENSQGLISQSGSCEFVPGLEEDGESCAHSEDGPGGGEAVISPDGHWVCLTR